MLGPTVAEFLFVIKKHDSGVDLLIQRPQPSLLSPHICSLPPQHNLSLANSTLTGFFRKTLFCLPTYLCLSFLLSPVCAPCLLLHHFCTCPLPPSSLAQTLPHSFSQIVFPGTRLHSLQLRHLLRCCPPRSSQLLSSSPFPALYPPSTAPSPTTLQDRTSTLLCPFLLSLVCESECICYEVLLKSLWCCALTSALQ